MDDYDESACDQSYENNESNDVQNESMNGDMKNNSENDLANCDENGDQFVEQHHEPHMRGPFWGPHMRGPGPGPHGPNGPMGPGPHGRGLWRGPIPPRFRGRGPPGPWPPRGPWRGPPAPPFFRGPRPPFRGPPPFDPNWNCPPGGLMGPPGPGPYGPGMPPMAGPNGPPGHGPGPWGVNGSGPHHRHPLAAHNGGGGGGGGGGPGGGALFDLDLSKVWVETATEQGKRYYYNAQSRQTTWTRPEGPDLRVLTQAEVEDLTRNAGGPGGAGTEPDYSGQETHELSEYYDDSDLPPGVTVSNGGDQCASGGAVAAPPGLLPPPVATGGGGAHMAGHNYHPHHQHQHQQQQQQAPYGGVAGSGLLPTAGPPPGMGAPTSHALLSTPGAQFNMPPPAAAAAAAAGAAAAPWASTPGAAPWGQAPASWGQQVIEAAPSMENKELDPELVARAADWSEHTAPDGRKYYYNATTQQSVWIKPQPLVDLEAARLATQQKVAAAAAAAVAAGTVPDSMTPLDTVLARSANSNNNNNTTSDGTAAAAAKNASTADNGDAQETQAGDAASPGDDGMEMDDDDDDEEQQEGGGGKSGQQQQEEVVKSAKQLEEEAAAAAAAEAKKQQDKSRPISSTPVPGSPWCVVWTGDKRVFFFNPSTRTSVWERPEELVGRQDVDKMMVPPAEADDDTNNADTNGSGSNNTTTNNNNNSDPSGQSDQPPAKKLKSADSKPESATANTIDPGKEAAVEAEKRAARERAAVPLDIRMKQFRDMLTEKEVSAFSTWEKELHKIVFDQRYLLLTARERKQVFEKYVKERAEEERQEKRNKMKEARDRFRQLLTEALHNVKLSHGDTQAMFSDFSRKYAKDERFRAVDKSRDRESLFNDHLVELRRKQKKESESRREQVKKDFFAMLREDRSIDHHSRWSDAKRRLESDARYRAVDSSGQREDWFRDHVHQLKEARRRDKKRDKKQQQRHQRHHSGDGGGDSGDGGSDSRATGGKNGGGGGSSPQPADDATDSERHREDGEHTDQGSDVDEDSEKAAADKEKREREEASLRLREQEVQRTLAEHLRDRDKERELHKHDEALQNMRALLVDLVRTADAAGTWRDARRLLSKDQRWSLCDALDKQHKEKLYEEHVELLAKKKVERFRELLEDLKVDLNSTWKEMKKTVREDPRYAKLSFADKRRNEEEFVNFVRDKIAAARAEFRQLLHETKCITHESLQRIADNAQHMKDILDVLRQDSRYLCLNTVAEEREQLIVTHLEELDKRGPPPPPTATEPARRLAK